MSDDEEEIVKNVFVDWIVPEFIPTQRTTHIIIQKNGPTELSCLSLNNGNLF